MCDFNAKSLSVIGLKAREGNYFTMFGFAVGFRGIVSLTHVRGKMPKLDHVVAGLVINPKTRALVKKAITEYTRIEPYTIQFKGNTAKLYTFRPTEYFDTHKYLRAKLAVSCEYKVYDFEDMFIGDLIELLLAQACDVPYIRNWFEASLESEEGILAYAKRCGYKIRVMAENPKRLEAKQQFKVEVPKVDEDLELM